MGQSPATHQAEAERALQLAHEAMGAADPEADSGSEADLGHAIAWASIAQGHAAVAAAERAALG